MIDQQGFIAMLATERAMAVAMRYSAEWRHALEMEHGPDKKAALEALFKRYAEEERE